MEKEVNKTNSSEGTAEKLLEQDGNTRYYNDNTAIRRKLISKLRFWGIAVLFIIVFIVGIYIGHKLDGKFTVGTLRFMSQKDELTTEQFSKDPIDERDFAWDSENVPKFIWSDFNKASILDYDGVEYSFGENKVYVKKEFMNNELEIRVNNDLGWLMSNFSIYSYGDNIVIYGYWNDEFRRITLGKTEESIVKEVLTLNPDVPFSANSKYISKHIKEDYIFAISEDMRTVSVYHEKSSVGEAIVLSDEILGFYDGMMILAKVDDYTDKLYMPYIIDNNGREELVCVEAATVTAQEIENVSDTGDMEVFQSYTTRYSAMIGYACCYIFENDDGALRMIVPNDIQKYSAYRKGTDSLKHEDDLGWHWITIVE